LSPSVSSSSSSLVSIEESAERVSSGYTSDGLMGRIQERKKGETGTNWCAYIELICHALLQSFFMTTVEVTTTELNLLWLQISFHNLQV
jgi:hypothetical protein